MKSRVLFVMPVLMLLLAFSPALSVAARYPAELAWNQSTALDNDGDTLANDIDPDDDNDGVADFNDPDPFNSSIPGPNVTPPPDPNASDEDSDGDTIPNDIDPDDNSGGLAPSPPPVTVEPSPAPVVTPEPNDPLPPTDYEPYVPVAEEPDVAVSEEPGSFQAPVVTALPSTGHGVTTQSGEGYLALVVATVAIAALAFRPSARPVK